MDLNSGSAVYVGLNSGSAVWESHLTFSASVSHALYYAALVRIKSVNAHGICQSRMWGSEEQVYVSICISAIFGLGFQTYR